MFMYSLAILATVERPELTAAGSQLMEQSNLHEHS